MTIPSLPPPRIAQHDGFSVVRDDLLPGGTKRRALPVLLRPGHEFVYAGPVYGYAQLALAYACADMGAKATVFIAKRNALTPLTTEAIAAGAKVVQVPNGYLSNVQAKARAYAATTGATLLPFGLMADAFIEALSSIARALPVTPAEVWCVAGSGTLLAALQRAWPEAAMNAVIVGHTPTHPGRAKLYRAEEPFERPARTHPPFPSAAHYDAKAWRFLRQHASPGALFWNVGA